MYCSTNTRRRLLGALLTMLALASAVPSPSAAAQATDTGSPAQDLRAAQAGLVQAQAAVVDAEQYLASVTQLELEAQSRLSVLSHREASLVRQIAEAKDEARRWTVDAYVNDRQHVAFLLAGGESDFERSARVVYASSASDQHQAAAKRYESLRAQVSPELADLAIGIADLETARLSANDAVLAARANEAEAERLVAAAEQRLEQQRLADLSAQEAARTAQALATAASTQPAPGADVIAAPNPVASELQGPPAAPGGPSEAQWAQLRHCEATGNYQAVSKSGKYRGAYQFDHRTWATLGPAGDPAAAPPAEQDRRAKLLYQSRGWKPWPHCGRYLR